MQNKQIKPQSTSSLQEHILVVPRDTLFAQQPSWHGIKKDGLNEFLETIKTHQEFHLRSSMEQDPRYKQIIPYLIFRHGQTYFLMQRTAHTTEQRLKNKLSIGIGGHMRQEDMINGSTVFDWARREFHEEVFYSGRLEVTPLGMINDDTTEVGQVHIGLALLLDGFNGQISVKSELKSGTLVSLEELRRVSPDLETWSQMVLELL